MLDSDLLQAIQSLSRATEIKSIASLLLKIIHQNLLLEKSILILDRQCSNSNSLNQDQKIFTAVAYNTSLTIDSVEPEPKITFYSYSESQASNIDREALAPLSLVNHCRDELKSRFLADASKTLINVRDTYFTQQKPTNFSYFPLIDREQFLGILYLENLRNSTDSDSKYSRDFLTPTTEQLIKTLVTQAAIAFYNAQKYPTPIADDTNSIGSVREEDEDRIGDFQQITQLKQDPRPEKRAKEALEAKIKQNLLLGKIIQKIRSSLSTKEIFKATVQEIGATFGVTRCQIHSYIQDLEPITPIFAIYQAPEDRVNNNYSVPLIDRFPTEQLFKQDRAVAVNNVYRSPLLKWANSVCQQLNLKSILAVRTSYQGEVNGLMMLHQCDRYREWTPAEIDTIEIVAAQVGIAIANAHLLEQEKQQRIALNRQNQLLKQEILVRKQDRAKLKQKSAAMEAAIDGMAILEREHFIYLNPSHVTIFGYDRTEELLGKSWHVLYQPSEIAKLQREAFPIFARQGYWRGECRAKKRDGILFDQEIALIKLDNDQMVCICRDISQRKQQERQLKESQQRYRTLATAAPVGIFRTDTVGNLTYANDRWCAITGLIPEMAMGQEWLKAIHPLDRQPITQQWQQAIENNLIFSAEYRFVTPRNLEVWVFGQAIAEYSMEGQLLGYVGTITDISKLKQSQKVLAIQLQKEQLLGQITQEIRRNWDTKAIFYTAATQIGEVFQVTRCCIHNYVVDSEPEIPIVAQYVDRDRVSFIDLTFPVVNNPHAEKVLSQDSAVASPNAYEDPLLSAVPELCQSFALKSMLAVRTSYQREPNGVIALHQCDRHREWTRNEIELLEAVAGQMGIAIAQARLLEKEQQQRQELYLNNLALTKAKQDAEVANQAKSQFLAHMSHELRTPLNAILGFSQIMVRDTSLSRSQQEHLAIINRSGKHLLNLINSILDLSQIEAGKTFIQEDCLDLYDFILGLEKMFQLQAKAKGLKLTIDIHPEVPQFITTDGVKLRQIMINLLNNGIKFTTVGEVSLQVKSQHQQSLIFKIIDSGAGIAKTELDRLFEPFEQTTTGINLGEGTGLGLSICRSLIELLGGILEVESIVGKGTTFLCQIPVIIPDSEQLNLAEISNPLSPHRGANIFKIAPEQPQHRILVVDDNLDNCKLLQDLLTQVGFMVREAHNGREAVTMFADWNPDLILMDIYMPIMDGYQATTAIKNQDPSHRVKIIATTASIVKEDRAKIIAVGCVDLISKPFDTEKLLIAIAEQLNISYTYDDNCLESHSAIVNSPLNAIEDLEELSKMPVKWLEKLYYAAISANEREINPLIAQISHEHHDLAQNLTAMVNNFALEGIINHTENLLKINS